MLFPNRKVFTLAEWPYQKSHDPWYTASATKKKMSQQNAVHDHQSVSRRWRLLVYQNWSTGAICL